MDRCNYFKISKYSCSKYVLLYNQFFEATVCFQPFHHVRVPIQASLLRILLLHQQSWIAASHPSGEAIVGFSFPSWKTKQLPDTTMIILPDQDFWVFTSQWVQGAWPSQWPCLRPLMEGQALGISCAPSVCARYNTHTHAQSDIHLSFLPLSRLFFSLCITLPRVAVIELWQMSRVRPALLPGGLAKWPFHYPTTAVFPFHR